MNQHNLHVANIANLTHLWEEMRTSQHTIKDGCAFHLSDMWPNRYWLDLDTKASLTQQDLQHIQSLPANITFPIWDAFPDDSIAANNTKQLEKYLTQEGYQCTFHQTAMILTPSFTELALSSTKKEKDHIERDDSHIKEISTFNDINIWRNIASESFGYQVNINSIKRIADNKDTRLLIHYSQQEPSGVAMVHKTSDILGIHQVGVLNQYRGKGIARKLMNHLIALAKEQNITHLTLQASSLGEPLYYNLGFKKQFKIRNYVKKPKDRSN
ncbi:GNAT family N-acetyltransferase [Marinomonas agarivorans]|nr:GNAT family N-acetyltransferase [Marinomonas agarivorans]